VGTATGKDGLEKNKISHLRRAIKPQFLEIPACRLVTILTEVFRTKPTDWKVNVSTRADSCQVQVKSLTYVCMSLH